MLPQISFKHILSLTCMSSVLVFPSITFAQDTGERANPSAIVGEVLNNNNFGDTLFNWRLNEFVDDATTPSEPRVINQGDVLGDSIAGDTLEGYVWSENVGWIDLGGFSNMTLSVPPANITTDSGVYLLTGQAWSEDIGVIEFPVPAQASDTFYVLFDSNTGLTTGLGWSDEIGAFSMNGVIIDLFATDPDNITLSETIFTADDNKILTFILPSSGGTDIEEVTITVENHNDETTSTEYTLADGNVTFVGDTLTFTHNFQDVAQFEDAHGVRNYDLTLEIVDGAENRSTKSFTDVGGNPLQVVAGEPDLVTIGTSTFASTTTAGPLVADGVSTYEFSDILLRDQFFNPVVHADGIKEVAVEIEFSNTVDTNQISFFEADIGDAICYYSQEFFIPPGKICGAGGIDILSFNSRDAFIKGQYGGVEISSYAPTSDAYFSPTDGVTPLTGANNLLNISRFEVVTTKTTPEPTALNVGEGTVAISEAKFGANAFNLRFEPLVTNTLGGFPVINPFPDTFTEGVQDQYSVTIENTSPSVDVQNLDISVSCAIDDPVVDCLLKDSEPSFTNEGLGSKSLLADGITHYDFDDNQGMTPTDPDGHFNLGSFEGKFNNLLSGASPVNTIEREQLITVTSILGTLGSSPTSSMDILSEIGYQINIIDPVFGNYQNTILYPGDRIEDAQVTTREFAVKGRIRSDAIGPIAFQNIGSVSKQEVSEAVSREVAAIVRNTNIPEGGDKRIAVWDELSENALQNGDILYYKNNDVFIGNSADLNDTVNIEGRKTLIVEAGLNGGDVYIEGNIMYQNEESSLGVIVLQGESESLPNVYIDPSITDMVGIWYVEGSILSWNKNSGRDVAYDGNNTFPQDLLDQLYIQGTLVSYNTVGGSRNNPPQLPVGIVNNTFNSLSDAEKLKIAQGFDLAYLRRYAPDDASTPAIDESTGKESVNVSPENAGASVIIEHDAQRLQPGLIPFGFESILRNITTAETVQ